MLSMFLALTLHLVAQVDVSAVSHILGQLDLASVLSSVGPWFAWVFQTTPVTYDFDTDAALQMSSSVFNAFSPVLAVAVGFGLAGTLLVLVKNLF